MIETGSGLLPSDRAVMVHAQFARCGTMVDMLSRVRQSLTARAAQRYRRREVAALWNEHTRAEFPAGLLGRDVNGVDVVMLDADVAGHVATWGGGGAQKQTDREAKPLSRLQDLDLVLPAMTSAEASYFRRLGAMSTALLAHGVSPRWPPL